MRSGKTTGSYARALARAGAALFGVAFKDRNFVALLVVAALLQNCW